MYSPLVVFGYKRKNHIMNTLEALNANYLADQTNLYIFLDGAKGDEQKEVDSVRKYVSEFAASSRFANIEIIKSKKNKGLANSIISGVSYIIEKFGKIIVVEDDLITTKNFLNFMNDALDFYHNDNRIGMIEGYSFPSKIFDCYKHDIYLSKRGGSWGWATWKDRWDLADWDLNNYKQYLTSKTLQKNFLQGGTDLPYMLDLQVKGKLDSWAIRWCLTMSFQNWMTVRPKYSMIKNCGMDGSGEHCAPTHDYDFNLEEKPFRLEFVEPDKRIIKEIYKKSDIRYLARVCKSIKARINSF